MPLEKTLVVDASQSTNANRNRVLLSSNVMVDLGIAIGDFVQICPISSIPSGSDRGRQKTPSKKSETRDQSKPKIAFGIAWPSLTCSHFKVELSSLIRLNCDVKIGDSVQIKKVESGCAIVDASKIVLSPVFSNLDKSHSKSSQPTEELLEMFLQQHLVGQYVSEGTIVMITVYGKQRKFQIESVSFTNNLPSVAHSKQEESIDGAQPDLMVYKVTSSTKLVVETDPSKSAPNFDESNRPSEQLDYSQVGGLKSQIEELRELVELPLKNPELFKSFGVKPPRGVLLYGPPGTGKTLLAKVLAQVTGATCFTISAPEIMSKYYGESESKLRDLFEKAKLSAPSIIFIDEIDAIAPKRDSSDSEVSKRIVGTLLTLMDGMESSKTSSSTNFVPNSNSSVASSAKTNPNPRSSESKVIVLGATNRPNSIDPALRRPGRFDREIEIPIPNESGRLSILNVYFKKLKHNLSPEMINQIAMATHGYVGADLSNLCKEASLLAFKRIYQESKTSGCDFDDEKLFVTLDDVLNAMIDIRPSAMREIMVDIPKVKWSDIGGYEEAKEKLKQAVEWPLKHPEAFKRLNIQPTRGVLLYGPPGCSKTLLAKAVATEAGLNFIPIKGPELFSKYVGESEKAVREVFKKARAASPSVIFFDEIDAIGGERGQSSDSTSVHDRVLAQMLNELDGIEPLKSVLFLAATNRPDIIDKALMRPGRIDQAIYISPPDPEARRKIFEICLKKIPHEDDLDMDQLVTLSTGLSGAEITSVCREAGLAAMQENINVERVANKHFVVAIQNIVPTITEQMINFYTNFAKSKKT